MATTVFALSLVGTDISFCIGRDVGGEIHFIKLEKIAGRFGRWKKRALEELQKAKKAGWQILIDDMTGQFTEFGLTIDLGSPDPATGRTYQNVALDQYMARASMGTEETIKSGGKAMTLIGSLVFVGQVNRYAIRPNTAKINLEYDDKGRPKYDIDDGLNSPERAMMLVVLGMTGVSVQDDEYAKSLFAAIEKELDADSAHSEVIVNSTIRNMIKHSQQATFARDICE